jgi:DNA-binding CsgD family transcriptional regulator
VSCCSDRAPAKRVSRRRADKGQTLAAIRAVARGEAVFGPDIARRLIWYSSEGSPTSRVSGLPREVFPELTDREREILDLIAAGKNNQENADALYLSLKTVRNYVSNIFTKLQVADRAQTIVRTREAGLGQKDGEVARSTGAETRARRGEDFFRQAPLRIQPRERNPMWHGRWPESRRGRFPPPCARPRRRWCRRCRSDLRLRPR